MGDWDVELTNLKDYGDKMVKDGQLFGSAADAKVTELKAGAAEIKADPRFTELNDFADKVFSDATSFGRFTGEMGEGIQSYGMAAIISHDSYGGNDKGTSDSLDIVVQQLIHDKSQTDPRS